MRKILDHLVKIEKQWNTAQQKFQKGKRETAEQFFRKKLAGLLANARLVAASPMLVQELEDLLSDAGRHPQGPLITNAVIASLHQIRARFKIPRHPATEYLTRESMTKPEPKNLRDLFEQQKPSTGSTG